MLHYPSMIHLLVLSMIQLSDIESNLLTIKKEIAANPNSGDPWARLGEAYLRLKDFVQAEDAFHEARSRRLSERRWAVPLGKIYLARKKYVERVTITPKKKAKRRQLKHRRSRGVACRRVESSLRRRPLSNSASGGPLIKPASQPEPSAWRRRPQSGATSVR